MYITPFPKEAVGYNAQTKMENECSGIFVLCSYTDAVPCFAFWKVFSKSVAATSGEVTSLKVRLSFVRKIHQEPIR